MNKFLSHRVLRQVATALLLATLGLRALVPVGYMPGNLLDGKFAELCPVASAASYALLSGIGSHHHHHQTGGEQDDAAYSMDSACPIGSSLFSDAIPVPEQAIALALQPRIFQRPLAVESYSSIPFSNYPARAPPVS